MKAGFCVRLPDGRIGRVREKHTAGKYKGMWRIRVKRFTSNSHQFLYFKESDLRVVDCPKGWMSVEGYNSYLRKTLKKMKEREK